MFLAIVVPVVGWLLFAFPIALVINLLYGQFLDGTRCRKDADGIDCTERTWLFLVSFLCFIIFHCLEHCCKTNETYLTSNKPKAIFKFAQLIFGSTFAFTFFPWFINDFLQFSGLQVSGFSFQFFADIRRSLC